MFCKHCGTEIEQGYKFCPVCGKNVANFGEKTIGKEMQPMKQDQQDNEKERSEEAVVDKVYQLEGVHRRSNLTFAYFPSEITVCGVNIGVKTQMGMFKTIEAEFSKADIKEIAFQFRPIWLISDVIRLIVFGVLLPMTGGLSMFAVILSLYVMCCRHLVLTLADGKKVLLPLRQDSDAIPLLLEIGYPGDKIQELNAKKITDNAWRTRELIVFLILLVIAAGTMGIGLGLQ